MKLDRDSLSEIDFDTLSRYEVVRLAEHLILELEKTRSELSESARAEVDLIFSAEALNREVKELKQQLMEK